MRFAVPLAGLLALGVLAPLAAHLLARRPPVPREFPTLLLLRASTTAAQRLRSLRDPGLWALRTLTVLVVVGAAMGPTLVTSGREAAWEPPVVRALVTDPLLRPAHAQADELAAHSGDVTWVYASGTLRASLAAALADLAERPTWTQEVVIRWRGSRRDLDEDDLEAIPRHVGVRLDVRRHDAMRPDADLTTVSIAAAPQDEAVRAVVSDAAPWSAAGEAPLVMWPGAAGRDVEERDATAATSRIADVLRRMQHDPRLSDAARRSRRDPRVGDTERPRLDRTRFTPLARSADGDVLLWGATSGARPLLVLDARPHDPLALWTVRAADDATRAADGWPVPDEPWTDDAVTRATRPPAVGTVTLPPGLDTRRWWLAALVLVLIETVWRRARGHDRETPINGECDAA